MPGRARTAEMGKRVLGEQCWLRKKEKETRATNMFVAELTKVR